MKNKILILFMFGLVLLSLTFVSSSFGYNNRDLIIIRTINDTLDPLWSGNQTNMLVDCPAGNYSYGIYDNGTYKCRDDEGAGADTNETIRVDEITQTHCAGSVLVGHYSNGTGICETDDTGGAGGVSKNTSGIWLYNDTTTIYFNNTLAGTNLSVNSSDYWDSLGSYNTTQFENDGGLLHILDTWFSNLFDNLFGTKDTDDLTQGSSNFYDNQTWNETRADTLYDPLGGSESDPLWSANYTNLNDTWSSIVNESYYLKINPFGFYNSTDFNYDDYLLETNQTLAGNYSATIDFCIEGGACLSNSGASETDPYWSDNFTKYNASWTTTDVEIWTVASNGTWAAIDEPLWSGNYTAYNASWSTTYNSTYDAYNNSGLIIDYNDTGDIIDWNATSYIINWNATGLIINWSGDYLTAEVDPYWSDNFTKYNSSWSSITNTSYYLKINPFGFYNSTDFDYNDYRLKTNHTFYGDTNVTGDLLVTTLNAGSCDVKSYTNGTLYCGTDQGGAETDPYWSDNFTKYNSSWTTTDEEMWISIDNDTFLKIDDYQLHDQDLNTTNNVQFTNLTLSQKITFALSEVIDNIIDGWISVVGNLNVTGEIDTIGNITSGEFFVGDATFLTNVPAGSESDPLWSANYTNLNDTWSSITNTSYYEVSNLFGFWNDTFATFNKTYADTLYSGIEWDYNQTTPAINTILGFSYYNLTTWDNPYTYWNSTFATFNKTYADTLYSTIDEPLWNSNSSLVPYLASTNTFTEINTFSANISIGNNHIVNQTGSAAGHIYHNGTGWVIIG